MDLKINQDIRKLCQLKMVMIYLKRLLIHNTITERTETILIEDKFVEPLKMAVAVRKEKLNRIYIWNMIN